MLEHNRVLLRDVLTDDLQVIAGLVLVNLDVQVCVLDESGTGLGCFQIMHECVLGASQLDAVLEGLLLGLESGDI